MQPLISVCILAFNRKAKVIVNLNKIFETDFYKNGQLEIIVVDNHSVDGTSEAIRGFFGDSVHIIRTEKNLGITGWNRGAKHATGGFLFFLDDDAYLTNAAIQAALDNMQNDSKIGIQAFRIISPFDGLDFNYEYPTGTLSFWGCGVMFRKAMLDEVGLYDEDFFFQAFELDLTIRARSKGWKLHYAFDIPIYHMTTVMRHQTDFKFYYSRRNLIANVLKHFSWFNVLKLIPMLCYQTLKRVRRYKLHTILTAIQDGILLGWKKRNVISEELQQEYLYNFLEFKSYSVQKKMWPTKNFWMNRKEYYPDIDIPFFKENAFSFSNAKVQHARYRDEERDIIKGQMHWFSLHRPPKGLEPLTVVFEDIVIYENAVFSAVISLVDERAHDSIVTMEIKQNNIVLKIYQIVVSNWNNCRHVCWKLNDLPSGNYAFVFYAIAKGDNDPYEFSTVSVLNAKLEYVE